MLMEVLEAKNQSKSSISRNKYKDVISKRKSKYSEFEEKNLGKKVKRGEND